MGADQAASAKALRQEETSSVETCKPDQHGWLTGSQSTRKSEPDHTRLMHHVKDFLYLVLRVTGGAQKVLTKAVDLGSACATADVVDS